MDSIIQNAINKMIEDVEILIEELNKNPLFEQIKNKKKLINDLSVHSGGEIIYTDIRNENIKSTQSLKIIPGQFVGRPLAKAVREYLEMRGKDNPPTYEEIEKALKEGDFDFTKVENARLAIVKNNKNFKLLSGDRFGLIEWYYTQRQIGRIKKIIESNGKSTEEKTDEILEQNDESRSNETQKEKQ